MSKKYYDKNEKEIKAGMTVLFDFGYIASSQRVIQHDGRLYFDGFPCGEDVPLDDIDLSNGVIEYIPKKYLLNK